MISNIYMKEKNICIVTLFKTDNSGSFLQAYALGKYLKKHGYRVWFYDVKYKRILTFRKYADIVLFALRHGLTIAKKYTKSLIEYSHCRREFEVVDDLKRHNIDCVILGSDTIWNLDSSNLTKHISTYWGLDFQGKVITYAGSVANTSPERFKQHPETKIAVSRWSAISVRDEYTRSIIKNMTDAPVELVCDPTFLLEKNDYLTDCRPLPEEHMYVFLYLFSPLSPHQLTELRAFAKEKGLLIIQGSYTMKGKEMDKTVVNSPFSFLTYMVNAEYIVTDTFHGTAFSINFNKNFVSIGRGKNKVADLLKSVNLSNRMVTGGESLVDILKCYPDYSECNELLSQIKVKSYAFLEENISG